MYIFKWSTLDAHRNLDAGGTVQCNKDWECQWQCSVSTLASYELKEILQSEIAGVESSPVTIWCTGCLWDGVPDLYYFSCRCRPAITTIVTWWSQISLQMENALPVEKLSKPGFLNNRLEKERWESEDLNVLRSQHFYNFAFSYSVIALPAEETVTITHWNRTEMKLRYI